MLRVGFRSCFRFLGPKSSSSSLHSSHTVIVTLILLLLFQCPSFLEGKIQSNFIFFLFLLSLSHCLLFFHSSSSSFFNHVFIRRRKRRRRTRSLWKTELVQFRFLALIFPFLSHFLFLVNHSSHIFILFSLFFFSQLSSFLPRLALISKENQEPSSSD